MPLSKENSDHAKERLLLLSARSRWSPEQLMLADVLAPQVRQWESLVNEAHEKFVSQMAYGNIATISDASIPEAALARLRANSIRESMSILSMHAAFDWFHNTCVAPFGIDYAYFKGPAIAARFYPDPVKRFFRDVDLLLPAQRRRDFLQFAIEQGCRAFIIHKRSVRYLDFNKCDDIGAFDSLVQVPYLQTPQGLVVEIHREIDNQISLFPTEVLLAEAIETRLRGNRFKVISDCDHIVFACYHHTRHLWSRLHWLADVDSFMSISKVDEASLLSHADTIGLKSTVEAAFELHALTSSGRHPVDFERSTPGIDLLNSCISNLQGGLEVESEMREGQRLGVFGFDWQGSRASLLARGRLIFRRFAPRYADTVRVRWTGPFRYPLAIAMIVYRGLCRRLTRLMRP